MFFSRYRIIATYSALACLTAISLFHSTLLVNAANGQHKSEQALTVEQIVEAAIIVYGGRQALSTVQVNGLERSIVTIKGAQDQDGQLTTRFVRKEKSWLDMRRIDLVLGDQTQTWSFNGSRVWATLNGLALEPQADAAKQYKASIINSYVGLLRYQEDGSKIELLPQQTIIGVDCYPIRLTREDGSKTTYYVSGGREGKNLNRTFRILHADYELPLGTPATPVKFRVSYLDFQIVQNTLVPFRAKIFENDQFIQEIKTKNITFNVVMDDDVFEHY